ncbi:putative transposable element [Trichonephila clavipes]|nr:putative transposable element [Trichonephila clavipes]
MVFMATDTIQDNDWCGLGNIASRTKSLNFKALHLPLSLGTATVTEPSSSSKASTTGTIPMAALTVQIICNLIYAEVPTDHQIGTSVHAPQRPMVTCIMMGTVVPAPHDGNRFNSCQVIYSQFGLAIHQNDHKARRRFVEWAQNEIAVVPDFHKRILFSDEAHFWLNGYVNNQNCRIWSEANPQVYVETPLHPEKLTVWCALWAGGIIGQYFFKTDEAHNVTVNGDRYRAMITNFFIPELNNHDVQELWFQQDGATCHTARATIYLLKDTFGDRLISRFGPVNWPPRSCDLTPLDYFLWGYVKPLVYADKSQTLDHLEDNIRRVIADIRPQMLEKVIENWTSRLDYIRGSRGSHMPEIIFKI